MNNGTILHFFTLENYEGDAFCCCVLCFRPCWKRFNKRPNCGHQWREKEKM